MFGTVAMGIIIAGVVAVLEVVYNDYEKEKAYV